MVQVHIFIGGYVHGVGFRAFVRREAQKLGLVGWVRNLSDRRVEVVAQSSASSDQGAKENLEKLITLCRKGPFMAEVKSINFNWEKAKEKFEDFSLQTTSSF